MDKRLQLKVIIKQCEQKFGRGDSDNWKHNDFIDFSKSIFEETKISISHNTLKRIFGKLATDKYYLPQQATFDALTEYCGFVATEHSDDNLIPEKPLFDSVKTKSQSKYRKGIIAIILLFMATFGYLFFADSSLNETNNGLKLTSSEGTLPKTCFFTVNVPNVSDSVFVDFGDKSDLVYLQPNQKTVSHTYFLPGMFDVAITDRVKKMVKSKVFISTDKKWYALGFQRQRFIPKNYYAYPAQKSLDSLFYITNSQLLKNGIDTIQPFFTRLCNFNAIKYKADSFIFETIFKKDFKKEGISCNGLVFKISGTDKSLRFNFVDPGCSSRITNIISEKTINGLSHNLSPFVMDFQKWNTIKLINNDKKLSLFVNGTLIYKTSYEVSLGELRGLFVEFERNGYFKKCSLKSLSGEELYVF